MKPKNVIYTLLIILGMLALAFLKIRHEEKGKELFTRDPSYLAYTHDALCQMNCRNISKSDVNRIMQTGVINLGKSDRQYKPCPYFALQGHTANGRYLRILFLQCTDTTRVEACYDLKKDVDCPCPGD